MSGAKARTGLVGSAVPMGLMAVSRPGAVVRAVPVGFPMRFGFPMS
ncbi:MAG: hypothetical protein WCD21_00835 [Streptomyces sp.]